MSIRALVSPNAASQLPHARTAGTQDLIDTLARSALGFDGGPDIAGAAVEVDGIRANVAGRT
jgi:hypothetical protein